MSQDPAFDSVLLILRRWRTVLVFASLGAVAATAYALLAPEWYAATLSVVPSQRSHDSALMMSLVQKLPGIETGATEGQRIEAVLNSVSVADEVIAKFKLDQRYATSHPEQTRETLHAHCTTSADRNSGIISLTCEDHDPSSAMALAKSFGEIGNRVFGRISTSSAHEEEKFLEAQVVKARQDVDEASRRLREFQETYKVIDLPEQSKAVISAMASIQGELISKQLELSYLAGFSSRTEAGVVQLQQQIDISKRKLQELQDSPMSSAAGTRAGSGSGGFFPGAMNVPGLRFQLEQLLRDQKIQETVFMLLTQRYELAKVEAARDTSTFEILDQPTLPTQRSRPKRRQVVMVGVGGGIAFACAWIVIPVWWRRRRAALDA